jgi:hypothetical protein
LALLTQNKAKLCQKIITALVFEKNANFFAENCRKIAENCDNKIDPGSQSNDRCIYNYNAAVVVG